MIQLNRMHGEVMKLSRRRRSAGDGCLSALLMAGNDDVWTGSSSDLDQCVNLTSSTRAVHIFRTQHINSSVRIDLKVGYLEGC